MTHPAEQSDRERAKEFRHKIANLTFDEGITAIEAKFASIRREAIIAALTTPPPSEVTPGEEYTFRRSVMQPHFWVIYRNEVSIAEAWTEQLARDVTAALNTTLAPVAHGGDEAKIAEVERLAEAWAFAVENLFYADSEEQAAEAGRNIDAARGAFRAALRAISPAGGR